MSAAAERTSWFDRVTTPRLVLRRITDDDLPHVVAVETDPAANAFRPGGAPSLGECGYALDSYVRVWAEHGLGYWVVERAGDVVGIAGARPMVLVGRPCWNLYYRFRPHAWGFGYAAEAAAEAVRAANAVAPERPVVARTGPTNVPSMRVAERLGLTRSTELDGNGYVVYTAGW